MNEATGIGKNVEKAIEDALTKLNTSRDNVDIKIIETGGLFKKAQVVVTLSEEYLQSQKQFKNKQEEKPAKPKQEEVFKPREERLEKVATQAIKTEEKPTRIEVRKPVKTDENESQKGKEFLENFLKVAEIEGKVEVNENDDEIFYTVTGEKVSQLIGYRGESLNSLQFLITVLNGKNNRKNKHVRLDIDNYRQKRQETLETLARRVCKKVLKTGHQTRLEPMTAFERRIIHTTVQEFEGLTSISRGEEPHRYLIIKKENGQENQDNE